MYEAYFSSKFQNKDTEFGFYRGKIIIEKKI